MPNLAEVKFERKPEEAVIAASLAYDDVALAIFASDKNFKESVIANQASAQQVESRLNRIVGRRILFDSGIVPIGIGGERIVVGILKDGEVHKYARNSTDPDGDKEAEIKDYTVCQKTFKKKVVETTFEVKSLLGRRVLREIQPWLDLVHITTLIANENPTVNQEHEEITALACEFPKKYGAFLDGGAPMLDRTTGSVVISDTSLVYINKILGFDTSKVDEVAPLQRDERTWASIANPGRLETYKNAQKAA